MGLGLNLLGRGETRKIVPLWLLHVAAAAAAGAVVGGALGWVGTAAGLANHRPWVIGGIALLALAIRARSDVIQLGRQRQVPRRWHARTAVPVVYLVWGLMLGSGLMTPIYHAAFPVLLAAQATAGLAAGAASGAVFGGSRQAMALLPLIRRYDDARTMGLLESLRPATRWLDLGLIAGGGVLLVAVAVR